MFYSECELWTARRGACERAFGLPPTDRRTLSKGFAFTRDRRGQLLLCVGDRHGGATTIVPGGVRLIDQPDERDLPLLWRYARWSDAEDLVNDRPPDFVVDTSLGELVVRHRGHARWMLMRSAEQLQVVAGFLAVNGTQPAVAKQLAYRRTLYVFLELEAACSRFESDTGETAPVGVTTLLERYRSMLLSVAPSVYGMTFLEGFEGKVELTHWGVVHSEVSAQRLLILFIKLFEVQRVLAEGASPAEVRERLHLLRGALDLASYRKSRWGMGLIGRHCTKALRAIERGRWSERRATALQHDLTRDVARLHRALRLARHEIPARVTSRVRRRPLWVRLPESIPRLV